MAEHEYSLTDIATATGRGGYGYGYGMGCGLESLLYLFPILALTGGFGGGFFGNRGNAVTEADLCNANSFSELKGSVRNVSDQISNMNVGLTKGLCDFGYTTLANFNSLERLFSECCCATKELIGSVKFDMANYFAAANANTNAVGQKVLDKLCSMEMAQKDAVIAQQGQRIAALEADARFCGIPRINPYGYGIYTYPNCQTVNNSCAY